ncbi:hypothetical protein L226DRAFT_524002 [Lentinus tigrinus ALCF2SS1-7]|uniref:uncharacterized protein n=1 Tax=Lentinus tigrinus ALCF2SS1-7 TaxID=1328758 RepID=UPI001165F085|nr:hypothetical protein L226DRAFT_524002 [Lentinus tigrinus ALCF2SS1-7]
MDAAAHSGPRPKAVLYINNTTGVLRAAHRGASTFVSSSTSPCPPRLELHSDFQNLIVTYDGDMTDLRGGLRGPAQCYDELSTAKRGPIGAARTSISMTKLRVAGSRVAGHIGAPLLSSPFAYWFIRLPYVAARPALQAPSSKSVTPGTPAHAPTHEAISRLASNARRDRSTRVACQCRLRSEPRRSRVADSLAGPRPSSDVLRRDVGAHDSPRTSLSLEVASTDHGPLAKLELDRRSRLEDDRVQTRTTMDMYRRGLGGYSMNTVLIVTCQCHYVDIEQRRPLGALRHVAPGLSERRAVSASPWFRAISGTWRRIAWKGGVYGVVISRTGFHAQNRADTGTHSGKQPSFIVQSALDPPDGVGGTELPPPLGPSSGLGSLSYHWHYG